MTNKNVDPVATMKVLDWELLLTAAMRGRKRMRLAEVYDAAADVLRNSDYFKEGVRAGLYRMARTDPPKVSNPCRGVWDAR